MELAWHDNALGYTDRARQELISGIFARLPGQKPTLSERKLMMRGPLLDIYAGDTLLFRNQPKGILLHYCPSLWPYISSLTSTLESICLPPNSTDSLSLRLILVHLRTIALHPLEEPSPLIPPPSLLPAIRLTQTAKLFNLRAEAHALDTRVFRRLRYSQLTAANVAEIWDTLPRNSIWITRTAAWLHAHKQKGDVKDWIAINRLMVQKRDLALFLLQFGREGRHELDDPYFWTVEEKAERAVREKQEARFEELRMRKREREAADRRFEERKANPQILRRLSDRRQSIRDIVARVHAEQVALRKGVVQRRWRALIGVVRVVVILARGIVFRWADDEFY